MAFLNRSIQLLFNHREKSDETEYFCDSVSDYFGDFLLRLSPPIGGGNSQNNPPIAASVPAKTGSVEITGNVSSILANQTNPGFKAVRDDFKKKSASLQVSLSDFSYGKKTGENSLPHFLEVPIINGAYEGKFCDIAAGTYLAYFAVCDSRQHTLFEGNGMVTVRKTPW